MADLKSLSPLAAAVLGVMRLWCPCEARARPRGYLYERLKNNPVWETTSFRAFRATMSELRPHGAGSGPSGWYLCANAVEAEQAAMYLRPHYQTIKDEMQALYELAARMRRRETKLAATIAGHQEALPLEGDQ